MICIINLKNYPLSPSFHKELNTFITTYKGTYSFFICPQLIDIQHYHPDFVFTQHCDEHTQAQSTGFVVPASLASHKLKGTLLNHSEHRITNASAILPQLHTNNLLSCVCVESKAELMNMRTYSPTYIAFEPPELIGTSVSVVEKYGQILSTYVALSAPIPLLVGAGIHTAHDIQELKKLNIAGVLIASHITKSNHPVQALTKLLGIN